ncbi:MAG: type II toxin-antitoxin system RelE/ParE family toxin [Candidatus Pacebacteria bacterium]|nr:type II toxin-antitoxin system RelE/ParE family toxin [Candidatus Paceibacterota bacterium]MCF7862451.1 type II toxin-antitoxin system RelE/ParE family toxin [Candidatus Paceibacterota bacterium]
MKKIDKFLQKIDKKNRNIIEQIVHLIIAGNLSMLDTKKLKGSNTMYRVRVGKVRIIFGKEGNQNIIYSISLKNDHTY